MSLVYNKLNILQPSSAYHFFPPPTITILVTYNNHAGKTERYVAD